MALWLGEVLISAVLIVVSVILYIMAGDIGGSINPADVGPAAFPRLMLAAVIVLSIVQIALSLKKRQKAIAEGKPGRKVVIANGTALFSTIGLMLVYGLVMPVVGFYISTAVFILAVMILMGNRKWLPLVAVPIGFNIFIHLVFTMFLGVSLP
ncbi:MAG: tripartite tricarboxylate transporter TctB family protein [Oscillospiraceae bacterium]|nr:tripartite tricarboxylate transporter TctB family protein [Oscillospiraceae bacterium]